MNLTYDNLDHGFEMQMTMHVAWGVPYIVCILQPCAADLEWPCRKTRFKVKRCNIPGKPKKKKQTTKNKNFYKSKNSTKATSITTNPQMIFNASQLLGGTNNKWTKHNRRITLSQRLFHKESAQPKKRQW